MVGLAVVWVVGWLPGAQDALVEVRSLRAAGRFEEALVRAADIEDPALRAFERLEVLYYAGDLAGALRAAVGGLEADPRHLQLLWRGTRLAIDLGATERAEELAGRLRESIDGDGGLDPGTRSDWLGVADGYDEEVQGMSQRAAQRRSALLRARVLVLGAGVVSVVVLILLSRGTGGVERV